MFIHIKLPSSFGSKLKFAIINEKKNEFKNKIIHFEIICHCKLLKLTYKLNNLIMHSTKMQPMHFDDFSSQPFPKLHYYAVKHNDQPISEHICLIQAYIIYLL